MKFEVRISILLNVRSLKSIDTDIYIYITHNIEVITKQMLNKEKSV